MGCDRPPRRASAHVATAKRMEIIGSGLGEALLGSTGDGSELARLGRAAVFFLQGPLGAGKTTLARGILRAFGVTGAVKSPSYTLVEPYSTAHGRVTHFDLYRLASVEEVEFLGMREYLDRGVCLFEWPERALGGLPMPDLRLDIALAGTARELTASALGPLGQGFLDHLILRELLQESAPNT